jgi:hypothetical protein
MAGGGSSKDKKTMVENRTGNSVALKKAEFFTRENTCRKSGCIIK